MPRKLFNGRVNNAGFHNLIRGTVQDGGVDYEGMLSHFSGQLGVEARAIGRGLIASRSAQNGGGNEDLI